MGKPAKVRRQTFLLREQRLDALCDVMASADYYRAEAKRCRELAAGSSDSDAVRRWHSLADDYDKLAEALDAHAPIVQRVPMQQQPQQQQQSKSDDKK